MLNGLARAAFTRLFSPLAALLLRLGLGPDAVTVIGTVGVCAGALVCYPLGQLFWGTVVITFFVFCDMLDGIMARQLGRTTVWGAFLDSTLDRLADSAVFVGLALWYFLGARDPLTALLALGCLVMGSLVSYVRARGEALGVRASGGIAERADRLLVTLVVTGLVGLGLPAIVLTIALAVLVVLCAITVAQRMAAVHSQLHAQEESA
ncbi:CDP-alcohol phosphatidyltransferase family protein [Brevibacterium sp. 5221]|uniref:Phosphatidylinositol phosphate synthase n=1 Tax=Brevibacterium rongguiense TaxID=2695267 RepID=A0A6N9H7W3_9MICO|nr:CDP-alcohol phosphatidyltransferase family protein [Brevibacterium rongguiense]MYM20110.1 CDP-alcohol phosphatidyltransferase family protein [Brevibacterium rongguiense]